MPDSRRIVSVLVLLAGLIIGLAALFSTPRPAITTRSGDWHAHLDGSCGETCDPSLEICCS